MEKGSTLRVLLLAVFLGAIIYWTVTAYNNKWWGIILGMIIGNSLGRELKVWMDVRKEKAS